MIVIPEEYQNRKSTVGHIFYIKTDETFNFYCHNCGDEMYGMMDWLYDGESNMNRTFVVEHLLVQ